MKLNTWDVEVTDTFGGEANYGWCNRHPLELPESATTAQVKRAAKRETGFSGHAGQWEDYGDQLTFRPRGLCVVMFVSFHY